MKDYNQYKMDIVERYQKEWDSIDEETQKEILEVIKQEEGETLDEWAGKLLKGVGRLPGIRSAVGLGMAGYRAAKGDWTGAALSAGSAIPGPVGWGFVGADIARDVAKRKNNTPGQSTTPGQSGTPKQPTTPTTPTTKAPSFMQWSDKSKSSTTNTNKPSVKKKTNYKFNFPTNFKTNTSYGKAKDDAYSKSFNTNRSYTTKDNKTVNYKSRTRDQVRADDRARDERDRKALQRQGLA